MRGRWLVIALALVATPAYADRVFVSGFEFCDTVDPTDASAEEQFIFDDSSATDQTVVATAFGNRCSASSVEFRGDPCSTNGDCGTGTCLSEPGDSCSFKLSPAGAAEWSSIPFRASDEMYAHLAVWVDTMPSTDGSHVDLAQFGTDGCLFRMEKVSGASTYQVKAYYDEAAWRCASSENDRAVCSENADCATLIAGQQNCSAYAFASTPPLDPDSRYELLLGQVNDVGGTGTVKCSIAESGFARGGATVGVGSCQVDDYNCPDPDGTYGCVTRCTDWTLASDPEGDLVCADNADCTGPATCDGGACSGAGLGVQQESSLVLGVDAQSCTGGGTPGVECTTNGDCGTGTCGYSTGWTYYIDDLVIDTDRSGAGTATTDGMRLLRIAEMVPDGDGGSSDFTTTGCTNGSAEYACIDDLGTAVDDDTTYLDIGSAAAGGTTFTDQHTLTNVDSEDTNAYGDVTTNADATRPGAVSFTLFTKDHDNTGTETGMIFRPKSYDGTNTLGAPCTNNTDCSGAIGGDMFECESSTCRYYVSRQLLTAAYAPWQVVFKTNPAAGAWTGTTYDSLRTSLDYVRVTGNNSQMGLTALIAEADLELTPPSLPGILVNQNGTNYADASEVTLCILGDSLPDDLQPYIASLVVDANNIIDYTKGGTTLRDLLSNLPDILDGMAGTYMSGTVLLGNEARCDYPLIMSGFNTVAALGSISGGAAPPEQSYCNASPFAFCETNGDCASGTCEHVGPGFCRGGADHGNVCLCERNSASAGPSDPTYPRVEYCLLNDTSVYGDHWLSTTLGGCCGFCSTNADCKTNIACSTNADCTDGTCDGTECTTTCTVSSGISFCPTTCAYGTDPRRIDATPLPAKSWGLPGCIDAPGCTDGLCVAANQMTVYDMEYRELLGAMTSRACESGTCDGNGNRSCATNADCAVHPIVLVEPGGNCTFGATNVGCIHKDRSLAAAKLSLQIAQELGVSWIDWPGYARAYAVGGEPDGTGRCTTNTDCSTLYGLETCYSVPVGTAPAPTCSGGECDRGRTGEPCSTNADCNLCLVHAADNIHMTDGNSKSGIPMMLDAIEACVENEDGVSGTYYDCEF